jgi:hypothetical protein
MADSKDSLKRQNYFDLKRDEFMAMNEYLQSPISEIDLRKMNEGGVASIENITGPIGMAAGGSLGDSAMEMDTLVKKLELQQILSLDMIDEMEKMNPSQINDLYNKYIRR